jgi:molybdopterin synthase sulfur carrier subunit
MSITIQLHPFLRQFANGQKIVEVIGKTIGECIDDLESKFPGIKAQLFDEQGKLTDLWDIYVNSESAYPELLSKPVKDGDELIILALVHGG